MTDAGAGLPFQTEREARGFRADDHVLCWLPAQDLATQHGAGLMPTLQ